MTVSGVVAIHVYTPSLPAVAHDLNASDAAVQLSIMAYMISVGFAQLLIGPLSDRFGRRPLMITGLAIFVFANALCALAPSIEWLIAARVLQAAGASTGGVLARAIVRDSWERDSVASLMGKLQMAQVVGAATAPIIGGQLATWFDWTAGFWFLSAFAAAQLVLGFRLLPETNRYLGMQTSAIGMVKDFLLLLRSPAYLGHCFAVGWMNAMYFVFFASAPFLFINHLGMTPSEMGYIMLVTVTGSLTGAWMSSRFAGRPWAGRMMPSGILASMTGSLIILGFGLAGQTSIPTALAPLALIGLGNGLLMPLASARAVSVMPRLAGTASAGFGFIQLMLGALGTLATTQMNHDSQIDMGLGMAVFCVLALLALGVVRLETWGNTGRTTT